ncbi:hypothetical protein ANN_13834 [Periplaneta americana]|uniref:Uncharacterized protein n=1 Tax=Periplaneta americana TaxID=6978 RepID=A0ABQ8SWS2_PERAM|nr:hypothetical protein ANN_13834 [Periplaneta americana]
MAVDIGHIRHYICLTWSQATKGNIEEGGFGPVLWIEFGVAQCSERLLLEDILFIDSNFKIVSKCIILLQSSKLQLSEALNIVDKVSQTVIQNNNSLISEKVKYHDKTSEVDVLKSSDFPFFKYVVDNHCINSKKKKKTSWLRTREELFYIKRRESFKSYIVHLYGEEMHRSIRKFEQLRKKTASALCSLAFLQRCRDQDTIPRFVVIRHHVNSLAARRIFRRTSLALVRERIYHTRRVLDTIARELLDIHLQLTSALHPQDWEWIDSSTTEQEQLYRRKATTRQNDKFNRLSVANQVTPPLDSDRVVVNLTGKTLDPNQVSVLGKGLNFALAPKKPPLKEIISGVEQAIHKLPTDTAEEICRDVCGALIGAGKATPNITKTEHQALRSLREDESIVVLPADKENASVVMESNTYHEKILELLADPSYKTLSREPTSSIEKRTTTLLKKANLPAEVTKSLTPHSTRPPRRRLP